jgi:hypothetical protein
MKYFKDVETGEVFAFEADGSQDHLIQMFMVRMTEDEVFNHLNPKAPALTRAEVERNRLIAYSDPVTGSDRHFSEQAAKLSQGDEEGSIKAEKLGAARRAEIQKENPWPELIV